MFSEWKRRREKRRLFNGNLDMTVRVMAVTDDKNLDYIGFMPLREAVEKECIVEITVDRRIPF